MKALRKIVALSDTHGSLKQFRYMEENKIQGDIFIHSGDFTRYGRQSDFKSFFNEIDKLKFKYKIVVAGNHQISLDNNIAQYHKIRLLQRYPCNIDRQNILKQLKKRCIYLEHQSVLIQNIRIFGSPYTKYFSRGAFQYQEEHQENNIFNSIPEDIDLLITHQPPYQILDSPSSGINAGSATLRSMASKIKPKVHIFGHIHESSGIIRESNTLFVNAAREIKIINEYL